MVEDGNVVGHRQGLALVVRDIDDGDAEPLVQVPDLVLQRLAQVLVQGAPRLVHQDQFRPEDEGAGERHALLLTNRLRARRGPVRAIMAVAHKLLLAAFHMLSTGEAFRDLGEGYLDQIARKRSTTKLVQRLSNLGYDVMLVLKAA